MDDVPRDPPPRWRKPLLFAAAVVVVLIAYHAVFVAWANPLLAVREELVRLRGDEDWIHLGGGYSSFLLGWKAHGRFRSGDSGEEVFVELRLASPFHGWRLSEYRVE